MDDLSNPTTRLQVSFKDSGERPLESKFADCIDSSDAFVVHPRIFFGFQSHAVFLFYGMAPHLIFDRIMC